MRLISLNIWGGTIYNPLIEYITEQSKNTDIFCFQEVFNKVTEQSPILSGTAHLQLFAELKKILSEFSGYFLRTSKNHDFKGPVKFPCEMGLATFVKKKYKVVENISHHIYGNMEEELKPDWTNVSRFLQQVSVQVQDQNLTIFNYHGIPKPGDKLDTPARIEQSEKISKIVGSIKGPKILCGDFNLYPETESIKILEQGMQNLIKNFKIENTRNKLSWNKHGNTMQHFADYAFTSSEINVENFIVPYIEISDHLPMELAFEV